MQYLESTEANVIIISPGGSLPEQHSYIRATIKKRVDIVGMLSAEILSSNPKMMILFSLALSDGNFYNQAIGFTPK